MQRAAGKEKKMAKPAHGARARVKPGHARHKVQHAVPVVAAAGFSVTSYRAPQFACRAVGDACCCCLRQVRRKRSARTSPSRARTASPSLRRAFSTSAVWGTWRRGICCSCCCCSARGLRAACTARCRVYFFFPVLTDDADTLCNVERNNCSPRRLRPRAVAASLVTCQLRLPRLRLSRFGAYPIFCRWAAAECRLVAAASKRRLDFRRASAVAPYGAHGSRAC